MKPNSTPTRNAGHCLAVLRDHALDSDNPGAIHAIAAYGASILLDNSVSPGLPKRSDEVIRRLTMSGVSAYRVIARQIAQIGDSMSRKSKDRGLEALVTVKDRLVAEKNDDARRLATGVMEMTIHHHDTRICTPVPADHCVEIMARAGVEIPEPTTIGELAKRGEFDNLELRPAA